MLMIYVLSVFGDVLEKVPPQMGKTLDFIGVPGRIRTCDLPLRRGPRYPAALLGLLPPAKFIAITYK